MKKILAIAASLSILAACAEKEQGFVVDETLHRTGKVTLLASMEDFTSKAEMTSNGRGSWKKGDEIAVQMTDGSFVSFTLQGTGDTKRAMFVGEVPSGKTLGSYAIFPASSFKSSADGKVTVSIPEAQEYSENDFQGIMVARIEDTWAIDFRQMLCYVKLNLSKYPTAGSTMVLTEPGKRLSGDFELNLEDAIENGISLQEGEGSLVLNLGQASSKMGLSLLLPVGKYTTLNLTAKDREGKEIGTKDILTDYMMAERAGARNLTRELDAVRPQVDGAIVLRGVVWIKGCLQRNSNSTNDGFQIGWDVAPYQWFSYNYKLESYGSYTYDPSKATQMRFDIDQNHCNHFNFGGIKEPYTKEPSSFAAPAGDMNICGRMFTDRECTKETSDFNAAAYGDLAFWASKGNYRLPTNEEIETLKECDVQYGHYITPDGYKVWGLLFTEPAVEDAPAFNSLEIAITDEMLETGLFLPLMGRRADSSTTVISYRIQGCYWSGNAVTKNAVTSQGVEDKGSDYQYADHLEFTSSKVTVGHLKGWAYDRMAGFAIRPVLADGGSIIPVKPVEPDPDPEPEPDPDPITGNDIKVGDTNLVETATGSKIFEAVLDMEAASQFTISIAGVDYGFATYSGAGGLGTVTNENTSFPCYNFATAKTANPSALGYKVSRAIGQMAMLSDGGNKFFTALDAAGKVLVRVDLNGAKPLYYLELVKVADSSMVFHEDFDLCTYGGDYMVAIPGTKDSAMDGVTPGSKGGVTANNASFTFDYPNAVSASGGVASSAYIANRGFRDWDFEYAGERPGALQLCAGAIPGHMMTPQMSALSAATDVTLTIDLARFSTSSVDPIKVKIVNGGQITAAHASIGAYAAAGTSASSKDYTVTPSDCFDIVDDEMCPHTRGNNDADKPHSVFTFKVSGLTPASRIMIDCPKGASNAPRCFIFDIKVTK